MIKIDLTAEVPDADTLELLLAAIRLFDIRNPGCHFKIMSTGGDQTVEEIKSMLERVGVPLVYAGRKQ